MFSPLGFPGSVVLYNLSNSLPQLSHTLLSPFEFFREPLMTIGIADGQEYRAFGDDDLKNGSDSIGEAQSPTETELSHTDLSDLENVVDVLREQYPRALLHRLLVFDCFRAARPAGLPTGTVILPPRTLWNDTTLKTVMCDFTSQLLADMTGFARSLQALPTIPSPSVQGGHQGAGDSLTGESFSNLMRRGLQLENDSRSSSPAGEQATLGHRASMPALPHSWSADALAARGDSRPMSPPTGTAAAPATTFDEMSDVMSQSIGNAPRPLPSYPSATSALRDASQDRVSVQGFGSGSVSERARNKGKGRVGMAIGSLYLHAGRWPDALREFVDNTVRARSLSDHLWHAKGLENILVCILLMAWAGMEVQVCFHPQSTFKDTLRRFF